MILYLHTLAPIPVISPTYRAHQPTQAVAELSQLIQELLQQQPKLMIVGSSMGGFYGQYLARQFPIFHLMMINPALKPWDLLPKAVGEQQNFVTGERYQLTNEDVEQTRCFGIEETGDGVPTTLFLDKGDEDIDYRIAADMYRDSGELFIFEGGDHRFQHMDEAIEIIRARYQPITP